MENANFTYTTGPHRNLCHCVLSSHFSQNEGHEADAREGLRNVLDQTSLKALITPESVRLDLLDSRLTDRQR